MKIALEIPSMHLEEISKHTDFDFALAHVILDQGKDSRYVKFYRKQAEKGREVWVDNGIHELGESLPLPQILKAAEMVKATHIVAPEVMFNMDETYRLIYLCKYEIAQSKLPYKIVGAWHGFKKDLTHLQEICDVVALPWRKHRIRFMTYPECTDFHYFGFKTLDEIRRFPPRSIDTSIPLKAAVFGIDLTKRERRPRMDLLEYDATLTKKQIDKTIENIYLLKEAAKSQTQRTQ